MCSVCPPVHCFLLYPSTAPLCCTPCCNPLFCSAQDRTMAVELSYVTKTEQLPGSLTRRWAGWHCHHPLQ